VACKAQDADGDSRRGARRRLLREVFSTARAAVGRELHHDRRVHRFQLGCSLGYALERRSARWSRDSVLRGSCPPCSLSHLGRGTYGLGVRRWGGAPKFLRSLLEDAHATRGAPGLLTHRNAIATWRRTSAWRTSSFAARVTRESKTGGHPSRASSWTRREKAPTARCSCRILSRQVQPITARAPVGRAATSNDSQEMGRLDGNLGHGY
jgi:hypothetical protein